ncbi:f-box protein cpr1 [Quercus suber]|uniref:F-box protein cpr1 n=1 Tax=Quercus suber TaxID=58331 RepID=A0AAW0IS37_QUESU
MISSTSTISNYVPLDVIDRILLRLPVNALIRFLCVSKEWSALINSSNFIKKHLDHSIETNSDRTLILKEIFVNPPSQSRWFSVPYSDNDQFGKAVQICQPLHNWEILDYCHGLEICSAQSVSLNGAFHWIVEQDNGSESILAFDFSNEKIRLYRKPSNEDLASLEVLGGCLCFIECCPEIPTYNDFWLMKEYGDESSWTRIYKIESDAVLWNTDYFKPLLFSKNGKKVLMEGVSLIWYDIKKKRGKKVRNRSFPKRFKTATCIESLLLLDGDNVIDPRQKKNKRKR